MSPLWILLTLLPILGGAERFNCKGRILGAYYADVKAGCKAFHVCVKVAGGGVRDFRFYCPPGTLFHQEAQTCTDWGDDDALACPADIYDGQFDLYRIGSGFDDRKLSPPANREDEAEFGLQRAETGDRRLAQNNVASNGPASDLRAAHSSDFFTGQRDRGRDDPSPPLQAASHVPEVSHQSPPRQSFRRATTQRTTTINQYTTAPPPPPQPSSPPQYETSKRKLVRKRPIKVSTPSPTYTFPPNTPPQQSYSDKTHQNSNPRVPTLNKQTYTTPNLPPQFKDYKDEYVEVSRVTPKQNRYHPDNQTPTPKIQTTPNSHFNKKEGLGELYNYDVQSTPGLNVQNNNRPFKVRNGFSVSDVPREPEVVRTKNLNNNFNLRDAPTTTVDYNIAFRSTSASTPVYKNYNSVSYEPEKPNYVPYSKQNYFNSPTIPPTTTIYTTTRPDPPANLNTVAYNTNIGFDAQSNNNYAESDEDDGQYRPPQGEDDGLYRPELYERELLTGAHSLNIAASGNRLPEDQKPYGKTRPPPKAVSQTAAPGPFRPAPTPTSSPAQTTRAPETYTTTQVPQTINTQRTFDYYQTYTTTSRPADFLSHNGVNNGQAGATTLTPTSRVPENRGTRVPSRVPTPPPPPTQPPTPPVQPRPTTRAPNFARPSNHKEDSSYDYAYYDSDPGFSEYDHIEEFGKTKNRN